MGAWPWSRARIRAWETKRVREPYVFPLDESPFSPDVPPLERRRRVLEVGADVVTDETGLVVDFMSEADVEGVLNDPRFAAVALPTLQLSGVESGPLWDLWTHLMFAKDSEEHKRIRGVVNRRVHAEADRAPSTRRAAASPMRCVTRSRSASRSTSGRRSRCRTPAVSPVASSGSRRPTPSAPRCGRSTSRGRSSRS